MSTYKEFKHITTVSLRILKEQGEKISCLTAYDYLTAKLLDQAGIDLLLVGDSVANVFQGQDTTLPVTVDEIIYHTKAVTKGVKRAMVVADMPFMSYQRSCDDALQNAGRIMKETSAGAVKLEGGVIIAETVLKLTQIGIPVMGHLGLTPQSIHKFGSYDARGREEAERKQILEGAKALEQAGAFSVVLEKIPEDLAKEVTDSLGIPTIGIGAGPICDGQILVTPDMLGMNTQFHPRFVRLYSHIAEEIIRATGQYIKDVKEKDFPNKDESYK